VPRPVQVPAKRPEGDEWLNGALVWAVDDWHQPMYLFPRDCPRILIWRTPNSTGADVEHWWQGSTARMLAYMERSWEERLRNGLIYRYEFPIESFEDLGDAGMWVSRSSVTPLKVERLENLEAELRVRDVELRVVESLVPLRGVWDTTLHASGIRLRNAEGWQ